MSTRSEQAKKLWEDPSFREKIIAASKEGKSTKESREKRSLSSKKLWSDPDYREKISHGISKRKLHAKEMRISIHCLTCECEMLVIKSLAKTKKFCSRACCVAHENFNRNRSFPVQKCNACKNDFKPGGSKQACCRECVPKGPAQIRWKQYGLTQQAYEKLLENQEHKCFLCEISLKTLPSKQIHVDHDHQTNVVRGILCSHCNRSLGIVECIPNFLQNVTRYLHV